MKLHDAFAAAADRSMNNNAAILTFRLVSVQDKPRDGSQGLYTTVSFGGSAEDTALTYHPRRIVNSSIMASASFEGDITFLLSDEFTSPPPQTSGTPSISEEGNPFNLKKPSRGRLSISEPIIVSRPYSFTLHNVDANVSFQLDMKEIGDLWVGLGSPRNNSTHNVGWMIAFGGVFSVPRSPN